MSQQGCTNAGIPLPQLLHESLNHHPSKVICLCVRRLHVHASKKCWERKVRLFDSANSQKEKGTCSQHFNSTSLQKTHEHIHLSVICVVIPCPWPLLLASNLDGKYLWSALLLQIRREKSSVTGTETSNYCRESWCRKLQQRQLVFPKLVVSSHSRLGFHLLYMNFFLQFAWTLAISDTLLVEAGKLHGFHPHSKVCLWHHMVSFVESMEQL